MFMGDVKTTKSGKISSLSSEISYQHILLYIPTLIGLAMIGRTLYVSNTNNSSNIHLWDDEDDAIGNKVDKWGYERSFKKSREDMTKELKAYIEVW